MVLFWGEFTVCMCKNGVQETLFYRTFLLNE